MPVSILICASATTPRWSAMPFKSAASSWLDTVAMTFRSSSICTSSGSVVGRSIRICSEAKPDLRSSAASFGSVMQKRVMPHSRQICAIGSSPSP